MDGDRQRLPANRNCYRLSRVSWALLKLLVLLVINSNLARISHRFRDMTSFPLKTHIFLPPAFNPEFENVIHALDRCNFACLILRHMLWLIIRVKSTSLRSKAIHSLLTTTTDVQRDDNRTNSMTVTWVYGRLISRSVRWALQRSYFTSCFYRSGFSKRSALTKVYAAVIVIE